MDTITIVVIVLCLLVASLLVWSIMFQQAMADWGRSVDACLHAIAQELDRLTGRKL